MKYSTNLSFFIFVAILSTTTSIMASNLKVGFYHKSCPSAETIVRNVVNKAISQNPGLGAGLIRMHFHDCFVRGCDASILLDPTPGNQVEKQHPANNPSLRGFEVIDEAKAELEAQCPETVSCADIIAFTARDSALRLGGINYAVKSGRRDGTISSINDPTGNLPRPDFNLNQLNQNFANKGLSLKELVTLSGAHTIGISHCSAFTNRLYSFNSTHPQDPSLDPNFALILKGKCPNVPAGDSNGNDPTVFFDFVTPNRLDNEYYVNLQNDKGILTSDEALMSNPSTVHMVRKLGSRGGVWAKKFAKAMVRMGSIQVLTGNEGEIRRNCRLVNS